MKTTGAEFDGYARGYRDIHTRSVAVTGENSDYYSRYKIEEIARSHETNAALAILDFGCGDGNSEVHFENTFPACRVFGVDVSEESLRTARRRGLSRSRFAAFDGTTIPCPDASFDLVFAACVFHHVQGDRRPGILRELRRVLKRGGSLAVFEHNPYNVLTREMVRRCPFDGNAALIAARQLRKSIVCAGFDDIRTRYTLFLPRYGFVKPLIFIERVLSPWPLGAQYYILARRGSP